MSFRTFRRKGFARKFRTQESFPKLSPIASVFDEITDPILTELLNNIGDDATAKRVRKLVDLYPNATIPELIVMDWLERGGWRYIYQAEAYGGRKKAGGLLPDFVVDTGVGMAWQVNGEYWHGGKQKAVSDAEAIMRLTGQIVGGVRIDKVVTLWESDLYRKRPQIFYLALAGLSLR